MSFVVDVVEGIGQLAREGLEQNLPQSLAESNSKFHETGDPQFARNVIVLAQIALAIDTPAVAFAARVESSSLSAEIARRAGKEKMTPREYAHKYGLDIVPFKKPKRRARVAAAAGRSAVSSSRRRKR